MDRPIPPALLHRYGPQFLQLIALQDQDGEGGASKGPDLSKPGTEGAYVTPDRIYVWDDSAQPTTWGPMIPVTGRAPSCADFIISAWFGEAANPCPPRGGFIRLLQQAEQKAVAEAWGIPCFPSKGRPNKHVDVVHRAWDCVKVRRAVAVVQARRTCFSS